VTGECGAGWGSAVRAVGVAAVAGRKAAVGVPAADGYSSCGSLHNKTTLVISLLPLLANTSSSTLQRKRLAPGASGPYLKIHCV